MSDVINIIHIIIIIIIIINFSHIYMTGVTQKAKPVLGAPPIIHTYIHTQIHTYTKHIATHIHTYYVYKSFGSPSCCTCVIICDKTSLIT